MDALGLLAVMLILYAAWRVVRWAYARDTSWQQREGGLVVNGLDALEAVADVIGRYMGTDIYALIRFRGVSYRFASVVAPDYKESLHAGELFMEPGLLYTRA